MEGESDFMSSMLRFPLRKPAAFALMFLCAILCFGRRGKAAVLSATPPAPAQTRLTSRFAIADFDGDSYPDLATVEMGQIGPSRARYWIGFQLSTGAQQPIGVDAPVGGLDIISRDVNGDQRLDLIVTTSWLDQPVAVLLNDGHGNFTLTDPGAFPALVWNSKKIGRFSRPDVKDAAIVALARSSGDCTLTDRISEASPVPRLLTAEISRHHAFRLSISVLARAPPFILHV
jgi:hypothetical protein